MKKHVFYKASIQKIVGFILLSGSCFSVQAFEIDLSKLKADAQNKFERLSEDLYAVIAYEDSQPAVSKAVIVPFGFEVGVNASNIDLQNTDELKEVGFNQSSIVLPRLYVEVDIFSLGLAATYTPLEGATLSGFKLKYSLFDGGTFTPAIALNANYTSLTGVDTLESNTVAYNVGISKGIAFVTVYANFGVSKGTFDPNTDHPSLVLLDLKKIESESSDTVFGGRFSILGVANVGVQWHSVSKHELVTLNVGVGF